MGESIATSIHEFLKMIHNYEETKGQTFLPIKELITNKKKVAKKRKKIDVNIDKEEKNHFFNHFSHLISVFNL